jgi:hypothetical protein
LQNLFQDRNLLDVALVRTSCGTAARAPP